MPMTTAHFVDVADTKLWIEHAGAGAPVVFLHGMACDLRVWDRVFSQLSDCVRALRYDIRGHGRSPTPTADTLPYTHGDDLAALLDALQIKTATIVGHSMGGRIAIDFALSHPNRLDHLLLISPAVQGMPPSEDTEDVLRKVTRALASSGQPVAAATLIAEHRRVFVLDDAAEDVATAMANDYSFWHFANANPELKLDPSAYERLYEINARTVVLAGDREHPDLLDAARQIESKVPRAKLSLVPGAGHWLLVAHADLVVNEILKLVLGAE